jgi:hypothetical protein
MTGIIVMSMRSHCAVKIECTILNPGRDSANGISSENSSDVALPALQIRLHRRGLEDTARKVLEGGERPPLALGVRARVVQALIHQRRVAHHLQLFRRREIPHVGLDPRRRPKERVGRKRIALRDFPTDRAAAAAAARCCCCWCWLWC